MGFATVAGGGSKQGPLAALFSASRLQALSSGGATAPAHGTGIEGLEALEAEPQWSMYVPNTALLPVSGKPRDQ
eukprot:symbB.v1.2.009237.t1/scaffold583.1/size184467/9